MSSTLTLPPEVITGVVSKAILDSLDQQTRDVLIRDAVAYLLNPERTSYDKSSPLQRHFHNAIDGVAREILKEHLTADSDLMQKLKAVIVEGVAKAFSDENREKMISSVASAVVAGMKIDKY